ncbi:MAG: 3-oxoacyl-[acyl-carrier-protein] reductase [Actinobacteria bacterium]|nr:MAG: 3-oxoacyl-[acyl-carrier-protein] reductase [Actinomycetota bacterium]
MPRLEGRTALVTGGSRGIGAAICTALATEGADIAVNYHPSVPADEIVSRIGELGRRAIAVEGDVSDASQVVRMVEEAHEGLGGLDILVNNAGITRDGLLVRMSEADWDAVLAVDLKSVFLCSQAAGKIMMKARTGCIVNIASVIGQIGNAGQVNYAAAKAGVIAVTKSTAKELASRGVRVNAVAPGFIQTPMTEQLAEKVRETAKGGIPLARFGAPEDVANAVLFLCSDESSYITGQVINVDGGMVM